MVKYSSTRTYESKTRPGVVAHLRKMSDQRRRELMRILASAKEKEREFARRFRELDDKRVPLFNDDDKTPRMNEQTGEQLRGFASKADEQEMVYLLDDIEAFKQAEVYPAYIRWGLADIEGLEIDGAPATIDSLLSSGPSDLVDELRYEIENRSELTAEQEKNLESPSITSAVEAQPTQATNAETVNPVEPSQAETAPSTSPSS